jgi:Protein of unknown function (DUF2938)
MWYSFWERSQHPYSQPLYIFSGYPHSRRFESSMTEGLIFVARTVVIGIGATMVLDLWVIFLKRIVGIPSLDWAMVGRWIGHFRDGQFVHDKIANATPVRGERALGWCAHYAIGVGFAALLLAIAGPAWARQPTFGLALVFGIATVVAPFFIMQPGLGAGIAASKTPNPMQARLRSLAGHTVFGIGLYLAASLTSMLIRS